MELNDVFKVCFRTSTKFVQWLQHNILHKILPVNHYLQKIKVTEIETCTFCERECETILRVLFMWTKVVNIWSGLSLHIFIPLLRSEWLIMLKTYFLVKLCLWIKTIILYAKQKNLLLITLMFFGHNGIYFKSIMCLIESAIFFWGGDLSFSLFFIQFLKIA